MPFGKLKSLLTGPKSAAPAKGDAFAGLVSPSQSFAPAPPSASGLIEFYNQSPSVRAIVSRVADSVARQEWYVENVDTGEKNYRHPLILFLKRGNKRLRGRAALRLTITHRDLAGESFWIIGRGPRGVPASYAPIPPTWVYDVPTGAEPDGGFFDVQPLNGVRMRIPAADVIWLRDPDPSNPYGRGKGGLTGAAATEIQSDEAAADYLNAYFKNYARPDMIVTGTNDSPIQAADIPKLQATWTSRFRGAVNAGTPFFFAKEIKVQPIGSSLKDNSLGELRKDLRQVLREVYGVPPEILGVIENSNRSTIDAASYLFATYTVDPRLAWLHDEIEDFARAEFKLKDNEVIGYDSPIAEDNEFALKVAAVRPEAFNNNEMRKFAGLQAVEEEGFDDFGPKADPASDAAGNQAEDPPEDQKPKKDNRRQAKQLAPDEIVRVSSAIDDPQVAGVISEATKAVYEAMVRKYGKALLKELGVSVAFNVNLEVASWLADNVPALLGGVDATTRDALKASLVTGVAEGETLAELVARVDQIFDDAIELRSPLIGQTVATELAGFTSLAAARQAGFTHKRWLTTGDTAVRNSHAGLNGQTKLIGEKFRTSGGHEAMHPGAFGVASEDINCRCAIRPVLEGEEDDNSKKGLSSSEFEDFHVKQLDAIASKLRQNMVKAFKRQRVAVKAALTAFKR